MKRITLVVPNELVAQIIPLVIDQVSELHIVDDVIDSIVNVPELTQFNPSLDKIEPELTVQPKPSPRKIFRHEKSASQLIFEYLEENGGSAPYSKIHQYLMRIGFAFNTTAAALSRLKIDGKATPHEKNGKKIWSIIK